MENEMQTFGFQRADIRLIFNLFKMSVRDRYLGSSLGVAWAVLQPVLLLSVYTFVFGFVLKAKLPGADTTLSYVVWMFSGLIPYLVFSEAVNTSANSVIAGSSLVKNIVFKSEALPVSATLTAVIPLVVGLMFLIVLIFVDGKQPSWHAVLLVPVVVMQFTFLMGLAFFLSATSVFFRDVIQALPTITMLFLFFTPIFYAREAMPRLAAKVTFFNPLYHMVQPYRDVLLNQSVPDWRGMLYMLFLAAFLYITGLSYFRRLKGYFEMAL